MIKIYQQYCMRTKIRPQGKRENKQALRIRVRTVHTVNVSSRNALHVGTNSTPLLLFFIHVLNSHLLLKYLLSR